MPSLHVKHWLACVLIATLFSCANQKTNKFAYVKPISFGEDSSLFWSDLVVYPYPVHEYEIEDDTNTPWRLTYMDVGKGRNTVVLLHGRGANAGYFSGLINYLVEHNTRVIAIDLPNYGKSLPLNRMKPVDRSLTLSRNLIRSLVNDHLRIKEFALLGHSLGGQVAMGYALNYPKEITHLILESSHGLEEFPGRISLENGEEIPLFDPTFSDDLISWENTWNRLGFVEQQQRLTVDTVINQHFVDTSEKDEEPDQPGVYLNKTLDAYYMMHLRAAMISRDPLNYERYIATYVRDFFAMGVETRLEDSSSITKKIGYLTMPVFFAFGEKDSLLPVTSLSENRSIINDLARPAFLQLITRDNPPIVVNYGDAGHVIHADIPEKFGNDIKEFMASNKTKSTPIDFQLL